VRAEFAELCEQYPAAVAWRDASFADHPLCTLLGETLPRSLLVELPELALQHEVVGSAGKGDWTHTPWVAVLNRAETFSVQEGLYVVYLLSRCGERLYLTVNQGCTRLKNLTGLGGARRELARRADVLRNKLGRIPNRLRPIRMDLNVASHIWRGQLYQLGAVVGVEYSARNLPSQADMSADLREAVRVYDFLLSNGSWLSDDEVEQRAIDDGVPFVHAKRYRYHRSIERQPSHSRRVKKILGTRCMGCDLSMDEVYGSIAAGMVDVHHLIPLSSLDDGAVVTFNPQTDFAILCPSCHRAIHRLSDSSDLTSLRKLIDRGPLDQLRVRNRS
jgi:5-methylcytosine-specific restriction protein A